MIRAKLEICFISKTYNLKTVNYNYVCDYFHVRVKQIGEGCVSKRVSAVLLHHSIFCSIPCFDLMMSVDLMM